MPPNDVDAVDGPHPTVVGGEVGLQAADAAHVGRIALRFDAHEAARRTAFGFARLLGHGEADGHDPPPQLPVNGPLGGESGKLIDLAQRRLDGATAEISPVLAPVPDAEQDPQSSTLTVHSFTVTGVPGTRNG